jgi:hypothetical protein
VARRRADRSRHVPRETAQRPPTAGGRGRPDGKSPNDFQRNKAIMGVFDEGCMGMYNAIIPDELLHPTGMFKERLSQSALYAGMRKCPTRRRMPYGSGSIAKGMRFITGPNPETDLTDDQILDQCRMYVAALRIADEFGCDAIGIQYQQGLKDLAPASDLVEGLLNNTDRPPGAGRQQRPRAVRRPTAAALQRSGRMRRHGCAGDEPRVAQTRLRSRKHAARRALRRGL